VTLPVSRRPASVKTQNRAWLRCLISCLEAVTICSLLFLSIFSGIPGVKAQSTNVTNVAYPSTTLYNLDTETSSPPLIVNATVNYEGARPGFYLDVGVFDLDNGNIVNTEGSASPISCAVSPQYAGCYIPLSTSEGSVNVEFLLGRPQSVWNLAILSVLLNSTGSAILSSENDYSFTIVVHTGLTLVVEVPIPVQVTIDGVNGTGIVRLSLSSGKHIVSVPEIFPYPNGTRLKFTGWSDGSAQANRTVALDYDTTLRADYVTQYHLTIASPVNVTGAGWYDSGSIARLSIPTTQLPMSTPLGTLGGKWVFEGWSENGTLSSRNTTQTLKMTSPKTISAEWHADFTLPGIILVIVIVTAGLAVKLRSPNARRVRRRRKT